MMTFSNACELISNLKNQYKVITPYHVTITWSFKFESKLKQYDPVDILYMSLLSKDKPSRFDNMVANLPLSVTDCITLAQLSNGVWKIFQGTERERYERAREEFTSITGIAIR